MNRASIDTVILSKDIARSRTLKRGRTYVIAGAVHVRTGARLTIEDGVTILIRNGPADGKPLRRCALVFDPGSRLVADRVTFRACDAQGRPQKLADNGGVWFLGSFQAASKDGISVRPDRALPPSSFSARSISVQWLGRLDTTINPVTGRESGIGDDVDGLSVLGVGPDEWKIQTVRSAWSADDGFDVTNSHIRLDRLEVRNPREDALNISSSRVEIHKRLFIDMGRFADRDRDLFDLETDDGASYVELHRGCRVQIGGVFGDQLVLSSSDMPQPSRRKKAVYRFNGVTRRRASLVYSIDED
jgi:hypothetical protein